MRIAIEDPRTDDVSQLLAEHLQNMREISPPESVHALNIEDLLRPEVTFWTAREHGALLGCAALKCLSPIHGEIKSMRTPFRKRRIGAGRKLLEHIIEEARARAYTRLSLETGSMAEFLPARALYESVGFKPCAPFGEYRLDPNSVFMSLAL